MLYILNGMSVCTERSSQPPTLRQQCRLVARQGVLWAGSCHSCPPFLHLCDEGSDSGPGQRHKRDSVLWYCLAEPLAKTPIDEVKDSRQQQHYNEKGEE